MLIGAIKRFFAHRAASGRINAAGSFLNKFGLFTEASHTIQVRGVDYWRESIYNYMLSTMVLVGLLAVIPSVYLSFTSDLIGLGIFDIVAYLFVVGLLFVKRVRYEVRATIFLSLALIIGLTVFLLTGDEGAGLFWIFVVPPLASFLLGLRQGVLFLTLNVFIIVAIGFLVSTNSMLIPRILEFSLESWVVYGINFLITNTLVTLPLGLLLKGLFQSTEAVRISNQKLVQSAQILQRVKSIVLVINSKGDVIYVSPGTEEITGYSPEELLGRGWWSVSQTTKEDARLERKAMSRIASGEVPKSETSYVRPIQTKTGEIRWIEWEDAMGPDQTVIGVGRDVTERVTMEIEIQESEKRTRLIVDNSLDAIVSMDDGGLITGWNPQAEKTFGWTGQEALGEPMHKLIIPVQHREAHQRGLALFLETGAGPVLNKRIEITALHRDGHEFPVELAISLVNSEAGMSFSAFIRDITEIKKEEVDRERRIAELEAIRKISIVLRSANSLDEMLPQFLETTLQVTNANSGGIWLHDPISNELKIMATKGWKPGSELKFGRDKPGFGFVGSVFANGKTEIAKELQLDERIPLAARLDIPHGQSTVAVPIRSQNQVIGVFTADTQIPYEISLNDVSLLTTLVEMAGTAIQRSLFNQKTDQQLEQMKGLAEIDRVILSSFDLKLNLQTLVKTVISQLGVDAVNIMIYNPVLQVLESIVESGFHSANFDGGEIGLGEGQAGAAALQKRIIHIPRLSQEQIHPRLARVLAGEDFVSYYAVPLIAKGEIRGVLEIFQRNQIEPDKEWMALLNALAGRAAVTIDTVKVFENLQKSNSELTLSYTAAIEGWSRALDLRDKETEGHSQRVTELGLKLAKKMGVKSKDLVQFRRGALLHDIGKMGIPDSILMKPGKLTEEEWKIMKQHPVFASDMLGPIKYLKEAVDIPLSHHEKWDGSGYPRGLAGENIPVSARIFAVIDVYDALTSDRHYRKAWSQEKAIDYIKEQSGTHFDPRVVAGFLETIPGAPLLAEKVQNL